MEFILSILSIKTLENIATLLGILYVIFLVYEKTIAWLFGALSSILICYIFFVSNIYLQSILNLYYVIAAVYGYILWKKKNHNNSHALKISYLSIKKHIYTISISIIISIIMYNIIALIPDSRFNKLDALIFGFSAVATLLQAKKIIENWIYWMCINTLSTILCIKAELYWLALLMILLIILSILGYLKWKKTIKAT